MRVSSLYQSSALLQSISQSSARLSKITEQIATQTRVNVPSDDPIASSRLVQLSRENSAIEQYQSNISRLSGNLQQQEAHVEAMSNQTLQLLDIIRNASNDTHSAEDMQGFGQSVDAMLETLVAEMNAKNENGHYLFAGTKNDRQPVIYDDASKTYSYVGNNGTREATVANGVDVKSNTLIADAFSSADNDLELFNQLKSISEKMCDPTQSPQSYAAELDELHATLQQTSDKLVTTFTDLGNRQNRLTLLDDAHVDVSTANNLVARDLAYASPEESYIEMNLYMQAAQATNATYMKISQLSLFDYIR